MFQTGLSGTMGGSHVLNKDFEVQQPPEDSISSLKFSPNSNYLVGSSWNNNVSDLDHVLCLCIFMVLTDTMLGSSGKWPVRS